MNKSYIPTFEMNINFQIGAFFDRTTTIMNANKLCILIILYFTQIKYLGSTVASHFMF